MSQKTTNLFDYDLQKLLESIPKSFAHFFYDRKRHIINLTNEGPGSLGYIRLPLHLVLDDQLKVLKSNAAVLYLSIESGNAAICVREGKVNIYHTTFSAYMTRKKQGVSQIKYLNKKGKSRAGSRVRLAKTLEFFEQINGSLSKVLMEYPIDRIALSCTATLLPYLYSSKVACPFEKRDNRLYKIPVHISQSNFTHLEKAIKKLMAPTLFYEANNESTFLDTFVESLEI